MRVRRHLSLSALLSLLFVGAIAPATANEQVGSDPTGFVTENVKSNPTMPQSHVLHDVRAGASLGDVVLWQEISPPRYKAAVEGLPDRWRTVQESTEDPISFDTRVWRFVSTDRALLSRGRAHVTPARWATWAVLLNMSTGRQVVFMNTHYVSSAWNSKPVSHKAWRKRVWIKEWQNQNEVTDRLSARGLTIMGGGDFNRIRLPKFDTRQVNLNSGSIDHLWVIPGAIRDVEPGRTWRDTHLYSDHDAVVASFTVESGARAPVNASE